MGTSTHRWIALAAVLVALTGWGCEPKGPEIISSSGEQTDDGTDVTPNVPVDPLPTPGDEQPVEPPPPPTIPAVSMTKEMLETCLVRVDDVLPDGEVSDLEGNLQALSALRGSTLTVVCFWRSGETLEGVLTSREILGDLQALLEARAEQGVQVIGINEGDTGEIIAERTEEAAASFPMLIDPEGALFDKVATERLPRIYLLDAEGKILWFDLGYSMATRRDLEKGIEVALGEAVSGD